MTGIDFSELTLLNLLFGILVIALFLAFTRLVVGPSLPDRVVALDLIAVLSVAIITTYDIATDQPVFLDAAAVVALITFVGTVAFARYLERRAGGE